MTTNWTAEDWLATDTVTALEELANLGIEGAAQYNLRLIAEATAKGDDRWYGVTIEDMR